MSNIDNITRQTYYKENYMKINNKNFYNERREENIKSNRELIIGEVEGVPAKIHFIPDYLSKEEADILYTKLYNNLNWQQREGQFKNGKKYFEPRLTCWYGKPYKYSSITWDENQNWDKDLEDLLNRLNSEFIDNKDRKLNSVMCNNYRDNKDSIGWHADDETSLGRYPKIASISLGCKRVFEVCDREEFYFNNVSIIYKFHLTHGSLLIMDGSVQEKWLHRVPKEYLDLGGRINLTYRHIVNENEEQIEIMRRKQSYNQHNEDTNKRGINQKHIIHKREEYQEENERTKDIYNNFPNHHNVDKNLIKSEHENNRTASTFNQIINDKHYGKKILNKTSYKEVEKEMNLRQFNDAKESEINNDIKRNEMKNEMLKHDDESCINDYQRFQNSRSKNAKQNIS